MKRNFSPKKCLFCGEIFIPNSPKQNICKNEHFSPCPDCGEPVKIKDSYANFMKYGPYRCENCRRIAISEGHKNRTAEQKEKSLEKSKKTFLDKYGVDNPMKSKEIREKALRTNQERYGITTNISQSSEVQQRIRENSQKRYGVDHYSNAPEIREKMMQGMIDKYGVAIPQQNDEIREKTSQTVQERYGADNLMRSSIIQDRIREKNQELYGVDYSIQREDVREKIKETCKEKYGSYGYPGNAFLNKMQDPVFRTRYESFISNPGNFIEYNFPEGVNLTQLGRYLNLDFTTVYIHLEKNNCLDLLVRNYSGMEMEVVRFIKSIIPDIIIEQNNRNIISPKEIDIYLPEYKIGIECNPTYTHNSTVPPYSCDDTLSRKYHKDKSNLAENSGIFLFHIFGYEWTNHREVIESMICNLLGKNTNKIYARKTKVIEISDTVCGKFLNENHRQGRTSASIRLGLYYEGNLVSVMTFNKLRNTMGQGKDVDNDTWELSRFCNLLNTSVVGGASKLLKYFIDNFIPTKIISFSDIAHTRGTLYSNLGFHEVAETDYGYVWVNSITDQYFHRVACQKKNLRKLFDEPDLDIENKTEVQIMSEHGYVMVCDSGVKKWELNLS